MAAVLGPGRWHCQYCQCDSLSWPAAGGSTSAAAATPSPAAAARGCFLGGTLVLMADGSARSIEELVPGDSTAGGTVRATLQVHYHAAAQLYNYRGVIVTGTQAVLDHTTGRFVRVSAAIGAAVVPLSELSFGGSVAGTPYSDVVFDLVTSAHRIYTCTHSNATKPGETAIVHVLEFADYEEVDPEDLEDASQRRLAALHASQEKRTPPAAVLRAMSGEAGTEVRVHPTRPPPMVGQTAGLSEII